MGRFACLYALIFIFLSTSWALSNNINVNHTTLGREMFSSNFAKQRKVLVEELRNEGVSDSKVLASIAKVPREKFIPWELKAGAYENTSLPIGNGQTISQPYIVALMTEAAKIKPSNKVLEIGTGSGYQAAILAELADFVHSIEPVKSHVEKSTKVLEALGYKNIDITWGNGYDLTKFDENFDVIIVTAAPEELPQHLVDKLKNNGRMVIPIGTAGSQSLFLIQKDSKGKISKKFLCGVAFVPMVH